MPDHRVVTYETMLRELYKGRWISQERYRGGLVKQRQLRDVPLECVMEVPDTDDLDELLNEAILECWELAGDCHHELSKLSLEAFALPKAITPGLVLSQFFSSCSSSTEYKHYVPEKAPIRYALKK